MQGTVSQIKHLFATYTTYPPPPTDAGAGVGEAGTTSYNA